MMKVSMWILLLISCACFSMAATADAKYTAMYIFGDSLIDPGNNIYFSDSIAKANYLPYGMDFSRGPTGRFSNGKILVDFLAELLGLPLIPSYADITANGANILAGGNYASAGAGILNDTGYYFGRIIPLSEQRSNFKKTVAQLSKQMQEKEMSNYLANALVLVDIGTNDYLNNYLQSTSYISSHVYNPHQFADLLTKLITQHIVEIHGLGLRKFLISECSPIGCAPIEVSNGKCQAFSNNMIKTFNLRLKPLIQRLKSDYPESAFMLAHSFQVFTHLRDNAEAYGFKVKDRACCGVTNTGGTKPMCFRNSVPCPNRNEYLFWDSAHPTEAADRVLAHLLYNATQWQ